MLTGAELDLDEREGRSSGVVDSEVDTTRLFSCGDQGLPHHLRAAGSQVKDAAQRLRVKICEERDEVADLFFAVEKARKTTQRTLPDFAMHLAPS
jgi:hypothetical protein